MRKYYDFVNEEGVIFLTSYTIQAMEKNKDIERFQRNIKFSIHEVEDEKAKIIFKNY